MVLTDFDKKNLNAVGQQAILTATDEWNKANAAGDQAGMAKWSAIAAQVRSTAGYETDSSGNFTNYIPGANTQNKSVTVIGNNSNNESAVTKLPSTPELNNQGVQNLPLNTENKPDITYLADTSQNTAAPLSRSSQQSSNQTVSAGNINADGKIYADGGSGKQFAYNPATGNIGVFNNGAWSYVTPDNELYNITLNAMLADTGKSLEYFNGGVTADKQGDNKQNGLPQDNNLNGITGYDDIYQAVLDYLTQGQNYQNTAIDNAVKQQQALIEAQKQAAQQAYLENNKNAYTAYQKAVNPYGYNAEVMAAMGLAESGLSESSLVAYGNALMAALQSNSISYNEAIAALENQKIQAQYEGDMNKAQIAADLQNQIASLFLELGNAQLQYSQQTQQNSQTDARSRIETYLMSGGSLENLDPQLIADAGYSSAELDALAAYAATQNSQTSQADARERIAAYLSMGGSLKNLDPQLIADSGYTAEELNAMEAYVNMQNANMSSTIGSANTGTGGTYGTSATTGTTDTALDGKQLIKDNFDNYVSNGGSDIDALNAYIASQNGVTGTSGTTETQPSNALIADMYNITNEIDENYNIIVGDKAYSPDALYSAILNKEVFAYPDSNGKWTYSLEPLGEPFPERNRDRYANEINSDGYMNVDGLGYTSFSDFENLWSDGKIYKGTLDDGRLYYTATGMTEKQKNMSLSYNPSNQYLQNAIAVKNINGDILYAMPTYITNISNNNDTNNLPDLPLPAIWETRFSTYELSNIANTNKDGCLYVAGQDTYLSKNDIDRLYSNGELYSGTMNDGRIYYATEDEQVFRKADGKYYTADGKEVPNDNVVKVINKKGRAMHVYCDIDLTD